MSINTNILVKLDWAFWIVVGLIVAFVAYLVINRRSEGKFDTVIGKVIRSSQSPSVTAYPKK